MLQCYDCGWVGEDEDCGRRLTAYEEMMYYCPECGSDQLLDVDTDITELATVPI